MAEKLYHSTLIRSYSCNKALLRQKYLALPVKHGKTRKNLRQVI